MTTINEFGRKRLRAAIRTYLWRNLVNRNDLHSPERRCSLCNEVLRKGEILKHFRYKHPEVYLAVRNRIMNDWGIKDEQAGS